MRVISSLHRAGQIGGRADLSRTWMLGRMGKVKKNVAGVSGGTSRSRSAATGRHTAVSLQRKATGSGRSQRVAADDPLSAVRVKFLTDEFGGAALAAIVGVNRSQPSRWIKGEERPGPSAAPLLIDLEHVLARARLVWGEPC